MRCQSADGMVVSDDSGVTGHPCRWLHSRSYAALEQLPHRPARSLTGASWGSQGT